jgi:hypothetical protein
VVAQAGGPSRVAQRGQRSPGRTQPATPRENGAAQHAQADLGGDPKSTDIRYATRGTCAPATAPDAAHKATSAADTGSHVRACSGS